MSERIAYSVAEAAEALGISTDSVYNMVYRGAIPYRRTVGRGTRGKGRILIPRLALEQWLMGEVEMPGRQVSTAPKRPGRPKKGVG